MGDPIEEFSVSSFPPVLVRGLGTCPKGMPPLFSIFVLPAQISGQWNTMRTRPFYKRSNPKRIKFNYKIASPRPVFVSRLDVGRTYLKVQMMARFFRTSCGWGLSYRLGR